MTKFVKNLEETVVLDWTICSKSQLHIRNPSKRGEKYRKEGNDPGSSINFQTKHIPNDLLGEKYSSPEFCSTQPTIVNRFCDFVAHTTKKKTKGKKQSCRTSPVDINDKIKNIYINSQKKHTNVHKMYSKNNEN